MIGSCNGLICFRTSENGIEDLVYILNPITREFVILPGYSKKQGCRIMTGFGYHPSTNEYKVVRIYHPNTKKPLGQVEIYTLGSGRGWREKGEITFSYGFGHGILANGELHWHLNEGKILAFNLANEEFRFITSPPFDLSHYYSRLCVLEGSLCLVNKHLSDSSEIWLLKKKKKNSCYNMNDEQEYQRWSWSKWFTIPTGKPIHPLSLTMRGEVILWKEFRFLARYDPKTATLEELRHYDADSMCCVVIPHINSFVSLKALEKKHTVHA